MDNALLQAHYRYADRMMHWLMVGLFCFSLLLAPMYDTWFEAIFIGGTTLCVLTAVHFLIPGHLVCRLAMATGLMVMTALHIQQTNGMIEVHFGVFVLLAILLVYRDRTPILVGAGVIAAHHVIFFLLQSAGNPVWVVPDTNPGFWLILVHAGYVVAESALLIYLAKIQRRAYLEAEELIAATGQVVQADILDLTSKPSRRTPLLLGFAKLVDAVADLARRVQDVTRSLNLYGQQLDQVSSKVERATREQSEEVQQAVDAITDMESSNSEMSVSAANAAALAEKAEQTAVECVELGKKTRADVHQLAEQIEHAAKTITDLNDRSVAISSVLDVIRTIADQTNLLALNAAIEAARAGEQGRGFAVVADEVRTLARRTQDSTLEIDKMIEALNLGSKSSVAAIEISQNHAESCVTNSRNSEARVIEIGQEITDIHGISAVLAANLAEHAEMTHGIGTRLRTVSGALEDTRQASLVATEARVELMKRFEELDTVTRQFKI